ncbi:CRISPR system precrRNA processing endoribonuclease RAMP protein Cas6 [Gallibacterium anatis]|uniref:CRISPR system precrRNA processing endoribonuclease RAMP protein Cas6 n=1 Tax=Gallibacterium anatis TaxID=750 RepID=UPI0039FC58EB
MKLPELFPIARYRFQFSVTENLHFPDYAGSMLRGAFGRALRKISCMTKQPDCKECPLYRTCPYPAIFETPAPQNHQLQKFSQVPNGYIIEPLGWGEKVYETGETLYFDLVLVGRLIEQLPLIAFAWQRAFEHQVGHGKAELTAIYVEQQHQLVPIYENKKIVSHQSLLALPTELPDQLSMKILTPMRIQRDGHALSPTEITLDRIIIGLAKRLTLLAEFHMHQVLTLDFEQLRQEMIALEDDKQLQWLDWTRYSSRQKQKMQLGGVVGEWHIRHISPMIAKLLYLGQWIHVGKNATFGLGKYQI